MRSRLYHIAPAVRWVPTNQASPRLPDWLVNISDNFELDHLNGLEKVLDAATADLSQPMAVPGAVVYIADKTG
ncbi:hypothetical protein NDA11_000064 [Ustilago hordei]|nr:hypothetical protein NDA11_000064 [Ustilago hordei]